MIYLRSGREKMLVIKALGCSDLRIFPGDNAFEGDMEELEKYMKTPVAQARFKKDITIIEDKEEVNIEEAVKALEKKNKMNLSVSNYRTVQENLMKKADEKEADFKKELEKKDKTIADLIERLEKLEAFVEGVEIEEDEPKKKKGKK